MAVVKPQLRPTDLMWEHVLCKQVLPYLSLKDLFQLRCVSCELKQLIEFYFSQTSRVHVSISYSTCFTTRAFEVLTSRNCGLKELILDSAGQWLTDEALIVVLKNNPNLHTVDVSRCNFISDLGVHAVGEYCRKICKFSVRSCLQLTGHGLQSFIINSAPLQYVDLTGCLGLTEDNLIMLVKHCKEIKYFILTNMHNITNRTVTTIAHCCPGLVQLSVQMAWRLTDYCILVLREFCPNLKTLHVMNCQQISECSLARLRERGVFIDRPFQTDSHRDRVEIKEIIWTQS